MKDGARVYAADLGCVYWSHRNLNAKADADDLLGLAKAINGGTNGPEGGGLRPG